jgi:hypothetical protein
VTGVIFHFRRAPSATPDGHSNTEATRHFDCGAPQH